MKVWTVLATWLFLAAIVKPPWVYSDDTNMRKVRLSTAGLTVNSYREFLAQLRNLLRDAGDQRHGISVLPEVSTISRPSDRYILVELENQQRQSVTVFMDVLNSYVIGYLSTRAAAPHDAYFYSDTEASAIQVIFPNARRNHLPFDSTYGGLARAANAGRRVIELGPGPLDQAITNLYRTDMSVALTLQARASTIVIQMVAEAARYRYIEGRVRTSIRDQQNFLPDEAMLSFQNNWGTLSEAVQRNEWPVQLARPNGSPLQVDGVTNDLIGAVALMLFICRPPPPPLRELDTFPQRSILASNRSEFPRLEYTRDRCEAVERRSVHIIGRDGLCVQVRNDDFTDGAPLILLACANRDSQRWTINRDGTIQSRGRCMTPRTTQPMASVVLFDCQRAPVTPRWQILDDGGIAHVTTRLPLTASASSLVLMQNVAASSQAWLPSNHWNPAVTTIMGLNELCLDTNGNGLWIENCVRNKVSQQWAMYQDGTIRPQNRGNCITSGGSQSSQVVIRSCGDASASMRWRFNNDGTLSNVVNTRLVMDVQASNPSLRRIILGIRTGNPNQVWIPMF